MGKAKITLDERIQILKKAIRKQEEDFKFIRKQTNKRTMQRVIDFHKDLMADLTELKAFKDQKKNMTFFPPLPNEL